MTYFYARVSSKEQNLSRQLDSAKQFHIDQTFCDKQSGKNFDRVAYQEMKAKVTAGDEVIVKELDRLGRNKELVKEELKWFRDNHITLRILNIPTTLMEFPGQEWIGDMVNNILIEVMSSMAQEEREKIRNRQREGIDAMPVVNGVHVSSKSGKTYGRKPADIPGFEKYLQKQKDGQLSIPACCRELGISESTWRRRCKEYESDKSE